MIFMATKKTSYVTLCAILAIVLALSGETAFGQNCNCAPNLCCSQWGYCGTTDAYCGPGCQEGPCQIPNRNISAEKALGQNCNCPPNMCCSQWGYCGTTDAYCGAGCQEGPCHVNNRKVSALSREKALGQNCNCPPNMCCSQWGYCGTTDAYCGAGCQEGPCHVNNGNISALSGEKALGQNCNCPSNMCCSRWGYCGLGGDYCGAGCQSGPCYVKTQSISVADIVTDAFFNGIANNARSICPGKKFHSRTVFLKALDTYPMFASGSNDVARREIAAFFAHVTHEAGSLCYTKETASGLRQTIDDGLDNPVTSFEKALWSWMNNNCHNAITSGQGFGATIRFSNGMECDGGNRAAVNSRVQYYRNYCSQLGVVPGADLYC